MFGLIPFENKEMDSIFNDGFFDGFKFPQVHQDMKCDVEDTEKSYIVTAEVAGFGKNDIKVLLITDSFGKAVAPYLAMGFAQIDYVYDADVSGVTPEFIESIDPDVVIMMYYPEFLLEGRQPFSFSGF